MLNNPALAGHVSLSTRSLTTASLEDGFQLAAKFALQLSQLPNSGAAEAPDGMAAYLRTTQPPHLSLLTAICFGTVAAANHYWREASGG